MDQSADGSPIFHWNQCRLIGGRVRYQLMRNRCRSTWLKSLSFDCLSVAFWSGWAELTGWIPERGENATFLRRLSRLSRAEEIGNWRANSMQSPHPTPLHPQQITKHPPVSSFFPSVALFHFFFFFFNISNSFRFAGVLAKDGERKRKKKNQELGERRKKEKRTHLIFAWIDTCSWQTARKSEKVARLEE